MRVGSARPPRRYWPAAIFTLSLAAPVARGQEGDPADELRAQLEALQPAVEAAIDRGVDHLASAQLLDGTWEFAGGMYPSGQTALCVYTLLKSGLPASHAAVRRGLAAMAARPPQETYSAALQLLALEATGEPEQRAAMEPILKELLAWQKKGLWSYPQKNEEHTWGKGAGRADLSNTQVAALGLRAAEDAGLEVPDRAWEKLLDAVTGFLHDPHTVGGEGAPALRRGKGGPEGERAAGFRYWTEYRFPPTGSMTAGGIAVLKLCLDGLGSRAGRSDAKKADELIQQGLNWLAEHWTVVTNPMEGGRLGGAGPGESWHLYYLYGLERVGAFLDVERIGGHPWYLDGARHLIATQGAEGSWGQRAAEQASSDLARRDLPDTCFALLFLKRASRPRTRAGEVDSRAARTLPADSPVRLRAVGTNPLTVWVDGFDRRVVADHGEGRVVRGLRVAQVDYLVDGELVHTLRGDPDRPWRSEDRFAYRHVFARVGEHELRARVGLVSADAPSGMREPDVYVRSEPLMVRVEQAFEPWMLELAELPLRNLMARGRPRAAGSSQRAPESGAERAVDGSFASRWLAAAGDRRAWVRIELSRPQVADTLLLCQAPRSELEQQDHDRIARVAITVNGGEEPLEVELSPRIVTPTAVSLGEPVTVRSVEVRVLASEAAQGARRGMGFAEIALELRR